MVLIVTFVFAIAFVGSLHAYPFQPAFAKLQANVNCHENPLPLSYHIHVTYMLTNDQQIKDVQIFREKALKHFAPLLGENPVCQGTEVEPSGRYGMTLSQHIYSFCYSYFFMMSNSHFCAKVAPILY